MHSSSYAGNPSSAMDADCGPQGSVVDCLPPSPVQTSHMYNQNKTRTMNAPYMSQHVRYKRLESLHTQKGDPDYAWKSHATNFGRGGIQFQNKSYLRDPRTGVWFSAAKSNKFPGLDPTPVSAYIAKHVADRPRSITGSKSTGSGGNGMGESHLSQAFSTSTSSLGLTAHQNLGTTHGSSGGFSRCNSAPGMTMTINGNDPGPSGEFMESKAQRRRPAVSHPHILRGLSFQVFEREYK